MSNRIASVVAFSIVLPAMAAYAGAPPASATSASKPSLTLEQSREILWRELLKQHPDFNPAWKFEVSDITPKEVQDKLDMRLLKVVMTNKDSDPSSMDIGVAAVRGERVFMLQTASRVTRSPGQFTVVGSPKDPSSAGLLYVSTGGSGIMWSVVSFLPADAEKPVDILSIVMRMLELRKKDDLTVEVWNKPWVEDKGDFQIATVLLDKATGKCKAELTADLTAEILKTIHLPGEATSTSSPATRNSLR